MPQTKAAAKALRASLRKREQNLHYRQAIKQVAKLARSGKKVDLRKFAKLVDKAARLGIVHANKAARLKTRLAARTKSKP